MLFVLMFLWCRFDFIGFCWYYFGINIQSIYYFMAEMSKAYEPQKYEDEIYKRWEASGFFAPDNLSGKNGRYVDILPPPNANGELHIGHASGYVFMDLAGRYNRMLGKKVLLLPGKDHAGIQTQTVYEKKILKESGITRHDLGRDKFYQEVYDFCLDRAQYMRNQEKKLGLSADWSREKFTLDPEILRIVLETFVKMHRDGLIYRGERIINWCPRCFTALSEVEVEYEEQNGKLYTFKYDENFPFAISTTRPETKLGDTAVAVNPEDRRYKKYIGKILEANFLGISLKLKIIADKNVDASFGTGALGVTPAHSMVDYEMAQKNDLAIINVINENGKIKADFGDFSGLEASVARGRIVERLKEMGLLEKEEDYKNNLSVCERCRTPIEQLISKQWFIDIDHKKFSLKKAAREAIEKGKINIYPERMKKILLDWIDNVHDWCISRQIWWGPRIPAWYRGDEVYVGLEAPEGDGWKQDEDTLDTWFSSGQWPYTTLGYPDGQDYKNFYPTDAMITGRDLVFFWTFRMIIMGLYRTGKAPFRNLYFSGLIRDEHGHKMSKSKGNGIEPLEMIRKYGTDAVRLALLVGNTPGNDMNLSEEKIAGSRNFVNKLWNIAKYIVESAKVKAQKSKLELKTQNLTLADKWILGRFENLIREVNKNFENYEFSLAAETLRGFTWDDFADWYLEVSKVEKNDGTVLIYILENLLKLWHPFIPFVTEEIWRAMGQENLLMVEDWPQTSKDLVKEKSDDFELVKEIITAIRAARAENRIEPMKKIKAVIYAGNKKDLVESQAHLIKALRTGIKELEVKDDPTFAQQGGATAGEGKIAGAIFVAAGGCEIYLLGAMDAEKETARLKKEIAELEKYAKGIEIKLKNKEFVKNAPEAIVKKEKEKLAAAEEKLAGLQKQMKNLK